MGSKTRRLTAFIEKHPYCCYCGGDTPAKTQDHFPPRSLFLLRGWPEGYVFPACEVCNNATSGAEMIFSMLARSSMARESDQGITEWRRQLEAVKERFPDVFQSLFLSPIKIKNWLRAKGVKLPHGATTMDVPVISIEHPKIHEAAELFATKLFCSLYYLHTSRTLPSAGGIVFRWHSNAQEMDKPLPKDILDPMLTGFPELKRQGTSLHDQFFYRYAVTETHPYAGAFLVFFHSTLALLGFVFPDIESVNVPENAMVLRPFKR